MGAVSSRITLIAACMGSPHITCASKRGTKRQYYLCEDSAHEKCRASCKSCDKRQDLLVALDDDRSTGTSPKGFGRCSHFASTARSLGLTLEGGLQDGADAARSLGLSEPGHASCTPASADATALSMARLHACCPAAHALKISPAPAATRPLAHGCIPGAECLQHGNSPRRAPSYAHTASPDTSAAPAPDGVPFAASTIGVRACTRGMHGSGLQQLAWALGNMSSNPVATQAKALRRASGKRRSRAASVRFARVGSLGVLFEEDGEEGEEGEGSWTPASAPSQVTLPLPTISLQRSSWQDSRGGRHGQGQRCAGPKGCAVEGGALNLPAGACAVLDSTVPWAEPTHAKSQSPFEAGPHGQIRGEEDEQDVLWDSAPDLEEEEVAAEALPGAGKREGSTGSFAPLSLALTLSASVGREGMESVMHMLEACSTPEL